MLSGTEAVCLSGVAQPAVAADVVLAYARNHAAERQGRYPDPLTAPVVARVCDGYTAS